MRPGRETGLRLLIQATRLLSTINARTRSFSQPSGSICFVVRIEWATQFTNDNVNSIFLACGGEHAPPLITNRSSAIFHRRRRKAKAFSPIMGVFGTFSGVLSLHGRRHCRFNLIHLTQARFKRIRVHFRRVLFRFLSIVSLNGHRSNRLARIKISSSQLHVHVTSSASSNVSRGLIRDELRLHAGVEAFRVIGQAYRANFLVMYDRATTPNSRVEVVINTVRWVD